MAGVLAADLGERHTPERDREWRDLAQRCGRATAMLRYYPDGDGAARGA